MHENCNLVGEYCFLLHYQCKILIMEALKIKSILLFESQMTEAGEGQNMLVCLDCETIKL